MIDAGQDEWRSHDVTLPEWTYVCPQTYRQDSTHVNNPLRVTHLPTYIRMYYTRGVYMLSLSRTRTLTLYNVPQLKLLLMKSLVVMQLKYICTVHQSTYHYTHNTCSCVQALSSYRSDRFFHFLRSTEGGETESGRDSLLCRNLSTPCCSRRRGTR